MYQINAREPPEKPNKSENFFSDFIPLAQPLHQTLQFIDAIAQHHHLAYQRLNLAQRHFRHRIVVVHSRIMRFRLFGRLAHDVLVTLPACDIAFDALVPDDRWAQSRGNEDRSRLLPCRYRLMQSIWNSLAYVILLSVTASIDGNVRRYSISALLNCRFVIFAPCKSPFDRPYR